MSTGADNKTLPVTREYEDGFERVFGKKEPERGLWVQDRKTGKLIPISEYVPETPDPYSVGDGIASGRFYENTSVPAYEDGKVKKVDIGSRRKHREYMRQNGLTTVDDFKDTWAKAEKERENMRNGIFPDARERRQEIGRIAYEVEKKNARRR